jgi:hypothetical protein
LAKDTLVISMAAVKKTGRLIFLKVNVINASPLVYKKRHFLKNPRCRETESAPAVF